MTEAERYTALRSQYLRWFEQTGGEYYMTMAAYCTGRIAEVG
jgi:hypothetical protein